MSEDQNATSRTTGPEHDSSGRPVVRRWSSKWVICPWCGHQHDDAWEWAAKRTETRCDECDNMFTVDPEYSVIYHSFVTGTEKP